MIPLLILLFLAVIIEGSITTIPIVLDLLLIVYLIKKEAWVSIFAFIFGILLDVTLGNSIGTSSLLFIIFIFFISLYERKFEVVTPAFIAISSFIGSFIFLVIFGFDALLPSIASSIFSFVIFKAASLLSYRQKETEYSFGT